MMRHIRILPGMLLALMFAACGGEPEGEAQVAANSAPPQPSGPTQPAEPVKEDPTAKMARAVGGGKPGAAVELKYEFASKPAVGVPVELELALIPTAGVEAMNLTVSGMEGITLAGVLEHKVDNAQPGEVYTHAFSVLPDRTGAYFVTAVVTTTIGSATLARTFSIPFVVGAPPPAEKAAPPVDATGEAIRSLPAQESSGDE